MRTSLVTDMQSVGVRGKRANYEAVSPIRKANEEGVATVAEKRARHAQQLRHVFPGEVRCLSSSPTFSSLPSNGLTGSTHSLSLHH